MGPIPCVFRAIPLMVHRHILVMYTRHTKISAKYSTAYFTCKNGLNFSSYLYTCRHLVSPLPQQTQHLAQQMDARVITSSSAAASGNSSGSAASSSGTISSLISPQRSEFNHTPFFITPQRSFAELLSLERKSCPGCS